MGPGENGWPTARWTVYSKTASGRTFPAAIIVFVTRTGARTVNAGWIGGKRRCEARGENAGNGFWVRPTSRPLPDGFGGVRRARAGVGHSEHRIIYITFPFRLFRLARLSSVVRVACLPRRPFYQSFSGVVEVAQNGAPTLSRQVPGVRSRDVVSRRIWDFNVGWFVSYCRVFKLAKEKRKSKKKYF